MVETEHTPNPDTLKFLPGKKVSEVGPIEFLKNDKSIKVSLANKILSLEGTVMVFFGEDFITVKKEKKLKKLKLIMILFHQRQMDSKIDTKPQILYRFMQV